MELDPRGQRFAAAVTSIVLIVVLATGWGWLALAQALVFAVTAADPRRGPYSFVYRALVLPRIGPPAEREPAAPVRFAQLVGFVFLSIATIGYLSGHDRAGRHVRGARVAGRVPERGLRPVRRVRGLSGRAPVDGPPDRLTTS